MEVVWGTGRKKEATSHETHCLLSLLCGGWDPLLATQVATLTVNSKVCRGRGNGERDRGLRGGAMVERQREY
jgi:hypothetical protein